MNIRKIGHCCLVIETNGKKIMTDPGSFSTAQNEEKNIDIVLITHEHQDHFHLESVKKILENNPAVKIITNAAVGKLLDVENIAHEILEHGGSKTEQGILLEGFGEKHAVIYKEMGQVENTGYFVDGKLFYPGDAFVVPGKPVDILALPVAGPWMKISEAIEYAIAVKPRVAFPVHDAIMRNPSMFHGFFGPLLKGVSVDFVSMSDGDSHDF
jgi:L-ascorbate metabolism protein UlaG (beta-lactamase superfamily)